MGTLIYGAGARYEFDDRVLSHLKIAVTTKLRMHEGFLVSWAQPPERGSGRVSLWLSPAIPVQYVFEATKPPTLNREWLEAMMLSATSSRGLIVMAEDEVAEYLQRGE
ncbi:DUF7882 family protein [Leifsonia poae]|uniref:DUF7882 domain-containing protein n=1 Tax=Leifsonia poae TaxID=110933 RepID=A0A9W6HAI2_9MICO|nr:hypothetical protein [Leifsonia poae]GLJ76924.1 hypothetical protein GCM10017584_24980 [Leifsonia poae]